jgi:hypothetical protein
MLEALFFEKSNTKVIFLNLICNGIKWYWPLFLDLLDCCILMRKYHYDKKAVILLFGMLYCFSSFFIFGQNYTIKGYSIENWFIRLMKSQNPFIKKHLLVLSLFGFLISTFLFWLLMLICHTSRLLRFHLFIF